MARDNATVHRTMSAIRGKDTGIEIRLRKALTKKGIRYSLYSSKVIGHPDILFESLKIAVFADSEFWHGYHFEENEAKLVTHRDFWLAKIKRNMARDEEVNASLRGQGYKVLRFWGKEIEKELDRVVDEIMKNMEQRKRVLELRSKIEERTTLVYVEKDGAYLMLRRDKEKASLDPNHGKWIGVGGHQEVGESIPQCLKREVLEETGLRVKKYLYCGKVDFLYEGLPPERMYLYKVLDFDGELIECNEGTLAWIKKEDIPSLNLWPGDRVFLPLLEDQSKGPFDLALYYQEGELLDVIGPSYKKKGKRKCPKKRKP